MGVERKRGRSGSARVWEWGERGVKVERDGKRERGVKWGESEEREWEGRDRDGIEKSGYREWRKKRSESGDRVRVRERQWE